MSTNLFNKPGYFLFQERMSYPCERIITTKYVKLLRNAVENYIINNKQINNENYKAYRHVLIGDRFAYE